MRPITLSMTAFGPFPAQEVITFDALGEAPLFLINGPTGSGKSTILDAICFALYGRTTGDEREGAQMRCDLAAPETLTEVVLTFELAGRNFRIRRVPEQQRPKARGEGTTTHSAEAQLYRLNAGGGEDLIVSSKVTEATREIEKLTGLSVEQFRQVMVLPQGKFRQLLMAESHERERIFSQLFQTHIYKQLEESLKAQSAEIRLERQRRQQLQKGILEGAGVESAEALQQELLVLEPEAEAARILKEAREAALMASGRAQQEAVQLDASFAELDRTRAQQAALMEQQEAFASRRLQLKLSEQAQRLKPAFDDRARCGKELRQAGEKLETALSAQEEARLRLEQVRYQLDEAERQAAALDASKQEVLRLESYRVRGVKLAEARQALALAEQDSKRAREAQQKAEGALQENLAKRESAEQEQSQLLKSQSGLGDKKLELQRSADRLSARQKLENLKGELGLLRGKLAEEEARGKRLRDAYEARLNESRRIELAWHQGQAAILAAQLEGGKPCPVCGSTDHPVPAHSEQPLPSQNELDRARTVAQEAHQALAEAREAYLAVKAGVARLQEHLDELRAELGGVVELGIEEISRGHDLLRKEVEALQNQARRLEVLSATLQSLKEAEAAAREALEQVRAQAESTTTAVATAQSRVQGAELELPELYRQAGALEAAIAQARDEAGRLEDRIRTAREVHKQAHGGWEGAKATCEAAAEAKRVAQELLDTACKACATALSSSPFGSEEAYLAALLDEAVLEALREAVADYDQQVQRVTGALEQQQAALRDKARPDLAKAEADLRQAETEKADAVSRWQRLDARTRQLESTRQQLRKAEADQAELDRRYAVVGTLSDVANGQTGDKVSLQRFVLSVLLDDVLVEASHRLSLMSKGRYRLLRKEDRAKGNKASGLELEVEDAYTGKVRPVATLSGGESFMAALSMALGLSDVVQAYAGGIRLDALFIDEGFGSLDSESLDLAIRTLVDLQSSGRMIGVISHVAELKEQMPLRLDVIAERSGSRVRLVVP